MPYNDLQKSPPFISLPSVPTTTHYSVSFILFHYYSFLVVLHTYQPWPSPRVFAEADPSAETTSLVSCMAHSLIFSKLNITFSMRPILTAHLKLHVYLLPQRLREKRHKRTFWGHANVLYRCMCYRSIYMWQNSSICIYKMCIHYYINLL